MRVHRYKKHYKKRDIKIVKHINRNKGKTEKETCTIVTIYLPNYILDKIEEYVIEGRVPSRSEYVRNAAKTQILIDERILIPIKKRIKIEETKKTFIIDGKEYKKLGDA